jgi:hypothetical protein
VYVTSTPLSVVVTPVTAAPSSTRCAPIARVSACGILSIPATGWNISIAWSYPNAKEKYRLTLLANRSGSDGGGPRMVPASVPRPGR